MVPNFPSNGIHGIKSQVCSNHAANVWIDILNYLDYGADHVLLLEFQGFKRIGLNFAAEIRISPNLHREMALESSDNFRVLKLIK